MSRMKDILELFIVADGGDVEALSTIKDKGLSEMFKEWKIANEEEKRKVNSIL